MNGEPLAAALEVIDALEELDVPYHLGGSFASSIHGVPRQTQDIDLVVDLKLAKVGLLVLHLQDRFYVDAEMLQRAIRREGSDILIHLETGFKIDVFIRRSEPFDRSEFGRHHPYVLGEPNAREVMVKSAEDILLRKIQWYREGRMVSDRQWNDILGIVRTQGDSLDHDYLQDWAAELEISDLLQRALAEGG